MSDNLRKLSLYCLFTALVAVVAFVGAFFYFNRGGYQPPPQAHIPFDQMTRTTFAGPPREFVDTPRMQVQKGVMLVDASHRNAFRKEELVTLLTWVADRGHKVEFLGSFGAMSDADRLQLLERGLSRADSLVVILPRESFNSLEVALVQRFVDKGGRLLLIADPTRDNDINSLAQPFGLEFQADYLFNQVEYELNFQNIFVRDFQPDPLTRDLNEIAFYTAGSIKASGGGLAATDENTRSSYTQRTEDRYYPMARGNHRNVLAIYDLTFLIPPHNTILDNGRLVANIADFLTEGQRQYGLADVPSFFKDDVDILLGRPALFNLGTEAKGLLAQWQIDSQLRQEENAARDTVFLGLYEDAYHIAPYLQASGVHIGGDLHVPSLSNLPLNNTSVIVLHRSQDRHVLAVLGSSEAALTRAVNLLGTGGFRAGLVDELVGVYKSE